MKAHEYRDDDAGYSNWLTTHQSCYVINIQRSHNPSDARLHDANCTTLNDQLDRDVSLTGPYVKVCGKTLPEVEEWAAEHVGEPIAHCERCRDASSTDRNPGPSRRSPGKCPQCLGYELSVTGKCPSCDQD